MSRLKLGTRQSPLALKQTQLAAEALKRQYPDLDIELVPIHSEGDLNPATPLSQMGGKGVFVKAIEAALLDKRCDIAVHSFKDMTSTPPDDLSLAGYLRPDVTTDCVVISKSLNATSLATLPQGARIGSSSLRRQALLQRIRPDFVFADIRGNVETRIEKCDAGDYEAILLSEAGLVRLGLKDRISESLNPKSFLPAPGQGVIALQCRTDDAHTRALCRAITSDDQWLVSSVEYAFMCAIGLGCDFPLGAYTELIGSDIHFWVYLKTKSGDEELIETEFPSQTAIEEAIVLGKKLHQKCL